MEESQKRRDRLKAMRLEADQAIGSSNAGNSSGVSPGLTNPLMESSAVQSVQRDSYAAPRFDYYTDPMSAFSANKRRNKVSQQVSQDYFTSPGPKNDMTPRPPAYGANTYSPDKRTFEAQGVYHSSPCGSQMQNAPFGMPHVNSPGVFSGFNPYSPDPRMSQAQGVYHNSSPHGSPMQTTSPVCGPQLNSPRPFNGPYSGFFPSNLSRGGNYPSHNFAQHGVTPSFGRGRGQRFNNSPVSGRGYSPHLSAGRGRGDRFGNNFSPGSSQRGRGRLGSHNGASAEVRPDLLYSKSMVEDPWKLLKPEIWRKPGPLKSWLPESIQIKKARVAEELNRSTSEPSLAEYLAASFNEAVEDAADGT